MISTIAVIYGVITFIACMVSGYAFIAATLLFIGIVISNVPEGIPIEVTVSDRKR